MRVQRFLSLIVLCGLGVASLNGCGGSSTAKGPTGTVEGTVTFDGQPVAAGIVRLYSPNSGESGSTTVGEGGKFTLTEPLRVGTYKAIVTPPQEPPPEIGKPYEPKTYDNIPEKYRSELTSDITVEIKAGDNPITVAMQK